MKCMDCPLKHTGQVGQTFYTGYKEHIQAIRNNTGNSGYLYHILNTGHAYGSMTDTMKIIQIKKKGKHLNILEKYHTYKISKNILHMNDAYFDVYNTVLEILQELNTRQGHIYTVNDSKHS
jgi:hypothetical protein